MPSTIFYIVGIIIGALMATEVITIGTGLLCGFVWIIIRVLTWEDR